MVSILSSPKTLKLDQAPCLMTAPFCDLIVYPCDPLLSPGWGHASRGTSERSYPLKTPPETPAIEDGLGCFCLDFLGLDVLGSSTPSTFAGSRARFMPLALDNQDDGFSRMLLEENKCVHKHPNNYKSIDKLEQS